MANTVIRNSPLTAEDMALAMNMKFDAFGAKAGIDAGRAWLERNGLTYFPLAEPNAVMATMFLHLGDKKTFGKFKAAMMACEDYREEHAQEPCKGPMETIRLNLQRNYANWLFRKGMFIDAKAEMCDPGFHSRNRPLSEKHADELVRLVGRLLEHDLRATGMLERLYAESYRTAFNMTYLRNIRWWLIIAMCASWRDTQDILPLAQELTGEAENPVVGEDPSEARRARTKQLMHLRYKWMRWAAARYAISRYRLK